MDNRASCTITAATQEGVDYIEKKLDEFNSSKVPFSQYQADIFVNYSLKNNDGDLVGGINALIYGWKCLFINQLWIQDEYRHNDYGSKLLKKVEDEAKAMGSYLAILDTFDFQAKDFYLKYGYEIYAELDNYPPGHKSFSMKKVLK